MSDTGVHDRLQAAVQFASDAGRGIMRRFARWSDRASIGLEQKADGSPVTLADREAEREIRAAIGERFPGDGVLGEEYGETPGTSRYRWVVDPIDGTASFVCGVPLFGTLIGIEREGVPVAGVIHMPALAETAFGGPGLGATHLAAGRAARPARVSSVQRLAESVFVTTSIDYYLAAERVDLYMRLARSVRLNRGFSDAYAFLLVATGRAEFCVEPGVKPWDIAAVAPVIEGAGGTWCDLRGQRRTDTGSVVASNGLVHTELMGVIGAQ
ncbi:MAG: inositol monophosphatase family protein [Phycisphaerales bacterium]